MAPIKGLCGKWQVFASCPAIQEPHRASGVVPAMVPVACQSGAMA